MPRQRRALVERLEEVLERRGVPRVEMAVITLCTGASGFLASAALLRLGLATMWLRYLLALLIAYLVFLGLLRLWLALHRRRLEASDAADLADAVPDLDLLLGRGLRGGARAFEAGGGKFGGGGASASFAHSGAPDPGAMASGADGPASAAADLLDADELVLPLALLAALVGALLASAWVVYTAPGLLAELLVDSALVGGLYHRLRRHPSGPWYVTALRKTALPFAATCLLFVLVGGFVQSRLPEARSFGDVLRHVRNESWRSPADGGGALH